MMRVLSLWSAQAHRELVQALLKLWTHRFRALVRGAAEAHGDGGADLAAALVRLDEQIELAAQMVGAVLLVAPCCPLLPCPRRRIQGGHRVHAVLHGWGPSDPGISRPVQGWVGGEELRTLHPSPPLALLPLQVSSCTERCEGQQAACWRTDGTFDQAAAQRLVGSGDYR